MKERILGTVEDLVSNFLYYDRKGDEELSSDDIKEAVADGTVTVEEIVEQFKTSLEKGLK